MELDAGSYKFYQITLRNRRTRLIIIPKNILQISLRPEGANILFADTSEKILKKQALPIKDEEIFTFSWSIPRKLFVKPENPCSLQITLLPK